MFYWNPDREIFTIPIINHPIVWYGVFFAFGFAVGYYIFLRLLKRYLPHTSPKTIRQIGERFALYVIIATVIGARLGHFIFYEQPSYYLTKPWVLLQTWKGGLASHGAVVAILIAIYFFTRWVKHLAPSLTYVVLLDLLAIPAAFASGCIRIGNFFNQEILGKPASVFWAVQFGNPMDGGPLIPRHPVQLYEAFLYFFIFILLLILSYKPKFFHRPGKMVGLLLILVFTGRFIIEFWKMEQSEFLHSALTMGQILSIPFIILGVIFMMGKYKKG